MLQNVHYANELGTHFAMEQAQLKLVMGQAPFGQMGWSFCFPYPQVFPRNSMKNGILELTNGKNNL